MSEDDRDRFPQAMIEGSTEYDWAELPDWLKDVMRHAADKFRGWADVEPIKGEVITDARELLGAPALPQANLLPHIKHLEAIASSCPAPSPFGGPCQLSAGHVGPHYNVEYGTWGPDPFDE